MVMELENVQADLQALRKLYGLLQNSVDSSISMQQLDERAKIVLKNLLDGATEKVLETHANMIAAAAATAAQSDVSTTADSNSNAKAKQINFVPKLVSPVSTNYDIKSFKNLKETNCYRFTSRNDQELSPNKHYGKMRKRCRGCEQRGMKQQGKSGTHGQQRHDPHLGRYNGNEKEDGTVSVKSNNQSIQGKRINGTQGIDPSVVNKIAASSSSSSSSSSNLPKETSTDFGREVANAISRIESGVLDLQPFNSGHMASINAANSKRAEEEVGVKALGFSRRDAMAKKPPVALKMAQRKSIRIGPVASTSGRSKKKKLQPHQVIVRPTLLEFESDESGGSTDQQTHTTTDTDTGTETETSTEAKSSLRRRFAYRQSGDSRSSRLNHDDKDTATGRLRRFKHKLGLIFHHHHHHHHYYDHDDIEYSKAHSHSNHLQNNMPHHKQLKNEICGKQAVDKLKQYSKGNRRKQQQANFLNRV